MTTVETELYIIQERLHDDEALWTRTELLRWFNDGYQQLVGQSGAVRRFFIFDLPPRTAAAGLYEWEEAHSSGTFRKLSKTGMGGNMQATYEWEIESEEDATPTNSNDCVTQLWEMEHTTTLDEHWRFYLPKSHERMRHVAYNDKRIWGVSDKELDLQSSRWWQQEGEPSWWLRGLGPDRSFEAYQIATDYRQNYSLSEDPYGLPREFSGDRTYATKTDQLLHDYGYTSHGDVSGVPAGLGWRFTTADSAYDGDATDSISITYWWESEIDTDATAPDFAIGAPRSMSSPDRQYMPMAYDTGEYELTGTARDFKSSADAVSLLESIIHTRDLEEDDAPALIPSRMAKYLRYYVWAMAYGRQGEAQQPALAAHYAARFKEGVEIMRTLAVLTNMDKNYGRQNVAVLARTLPAHPRLPSTYPSIGRL